MRIPAIQATFWTVCALFCAPLLLPACNDGENINPIPQLSELTCSVEPVDADNPTTPEEKGYRAVLDFRYLDQDDDLSSDGAHIQWWINDVQQDDRSLAGENLNISGTIRFSASPLQAFEIYEFRLSVVDGAGNESNVLNAVIDTDSPARCTPAGA